MKLKSEERTLYWQACSTPVIEMAICTDSMVVVEIVTGKSREDVAERMALRHSGITYQESSVGNLACTQLQEYFSGRRRDFSVPVELAGVSPFARRVLTVLQKLPFGETVSYGELAAHAGNPLAARAVGRIMANNHLPIIIPCHRVIGKNGSMTGYSGGDGIRTKEWLLNFERRCLAESD